MERTYINEVQKEIGSTVKVQGFIENLRNSKYMAFIVLKDITGKLQITVEKEDHPELAVEMTGDENLTGLENMRRLQCTAGSGSQQLQILYH